VATTRTTSTLSSSTYELVDHAKQPASPAAGPYGHPFHPMFVTIPIGAWVSALVFDIATRVRDGGDQGLAHGSYWLIGIGIVGALAAAVFGLMDLTRLPRGSMAMKLGLTHMALNLTAVALFVVNFLWRHESSYEDPKVRTGQLVLTVVALGVLSMSGWIGGMLAYKFGVRVAHETDQAKGFDPA
jgi:uncharacterized membrane protein